ncbi:MAG: DUF1572 domain-containing protein [Planctomycetaceae bacterium]|nr:DUF1572 domain-containing protein [Planctomycetaceae bacterium]
MREQIIRECQCLLDQAMSRTRHCVTQLSFEQLWWRPGPDQNSVGIILRHVTGNLRQWAICGLTGAADHRDRAEEFHGDAQQSAPELLAGLEAVVADVGRAMQGLSTEQLQQERTIQGFRVSGLGALLHTIPHFVGHTHQIVALTRQQLGHGYTFHWTPDAPRDVVPL